MYVLLHCVYSETNDITLISWWSDIELYNSNVLSAAIKVCNNTYAVHSSMFSFARFLCEKTWFWSNQVELDSQFWSISIKHSSMSLKNIYFMQTVYSLMLNNLDCSVFFSMHMPRLSLKWARKRICTVMVLWWSIHIQNKKRINLKIPLRLCLTIVRNHSILLLWKAKGRKCMSIVTKLSALV